MVWMIYDGSLQSMCILYWSEIQYGLRLTEDPIGEWITVVLSGITKFFKTQIIHEWSLDGMVPYKVYILYVLISNPLLNKD